MLGVICGAIQIADVTINKKISNYKTALERYMLNEHNQRSFAKCW